MARFKVLLDNSKEAITYMNVVSNKLQNNNMVDNPFTATVRHIGFEWVIDITPIYPDFSPMGVIPLGLGIIFGLNKIALGLGIFLLSTHFLYSNIFYFLCVKRGLRVAGYKGYVGYRRYGTK